MRRLKLTRLVLVVLAGLTLTAGACPEKDDCQVQVIGSFVAASGQTINVYGCR